MTALSLLVIALLIANNAAAYFWLRIRLQHHETWVLDQTAFQAPSPVIAPDPRVDELMRIVGTLRGAEALKQTLGKK